MNDKWRAFVVVILFAVLYAGCGVMVTHSGSPSSQPVSVTLSPVSVTMDTSSTLKFVATVHNSQDQAVDWRVDGKAGGNATVGTISSTGLYTAPKQVPSSSATVNVTAVSHADPTKSASAAVTPWGMGTLKVSPSRVTVPAGATQQFTYTSLGSNPELFDWAVNGIEGGNATLGTISAGGIYTTPAVPPPGGAVTVTVTRFCLCDDPAEGMATVTNVFSDASLTGSYVFTLGIDNQDSPVYLAGRFVADGKGGLAEGTSDVQHAGGVSAQQPFTGTYTVQPDGRGTLTLTTQGSQQTTTYEFELTSTGGGPLLRFQNSVNGSEQIYKQDAATFSDASLKGSYAFQLLASSSSGSLAEAGVCASDGVGNITSGMEDINDGKNVESKIPVTGTYSVDPTGRVTATIAASGGTASNTSQLVMYLISSNRAVFVSMGNTGAAGVGVTEKQQITSFSNGSLSGDFVYVSTGDQATEANSSLGRFAADGAGKISAGVLDENDAGSVSQDVFFAGAYSIPATDLGRGTASLTTSEGTVDFIFYMVTDKTAFVVGANTSSVQGGKLVAQSPFSKSSFQGNLALSFRGFDTLGEVGQLSDFSTDGSGTLTGNEDINDAGTLTTNVTLSGTYSIGQNGRGQLTTSAGGIVSTFNIYVVDSSEAFLIGIDSNNTVFGSTARQF